MTFSKLSPLDEEQLVVYIKATPSFSSEIGENYNDITIKEVGDGNLNFVYIVDGTWGSFVIKQTLIYVLGESWWMIKEGSYFGAKTSKEHGGLWPEHVPQLYHFDRTVSSIVIEHPSLAEHMAEHERAGESLVLLLELAKTLLKLLWIGEVISAIRQVHQW
ncbi:methylthioribose kinase-like [Hibiscus syriacus]|uniref:methylthioribose kinase-like n=1 Tax=Hibiscus syriacus TaxID=106335 RepID=UPI0019248153|nr:methylthioribose kinase-like [Hibiscus syriacus]